MKHASGLHATELPEASEYLEGWKRARAELENVKARMHDEANLTRDRITREVIEDMVSIADNFQALVQHVPPDKASDPWVQGVLHVARHFIQTLENYGVELIDPKEGEFNPALHEAVDQVEGEEGKSGKIAKVVQVGYKFKDTVIRPAKVQVHT